MAKLFSTSKKANSTETTLAMFGRMWSEASEERKKEDWKWFLNGLWTRGFHYARYDSKTKQVVGTPAIDGRPKITINKIYPTLRSVRNYVLRNQPKAEVTPENLSPDSLDQSLMATKFLDYIHETEKLRPKLKGTTWQALEDSVGWWQVLWDGEKICVNAVDVFDFYPDPKANTPQQMKYGILAVRRRISDLQGDSMYDQNEVNQIKVDNKVSSSSYKDMLLSYEKSEATSNTRKEGDGTVIVKEFWYIEKDKAGNETVMLGAEAGGRLIRKPERVETKIIPFFRLASDIMPFSMYGQGWVKNMIDPQKLLNSGMSSIAEYNLIMNKIKVVVDKGAGIRTWNNQHGQFIEKKRGFEATTMPVAPLSAAIYQQIDLANTFIEDIGSMHDAMRGRTPAAGSSGRAIEALQIGDSNNMSELVENVEDFLEDVYEHILWLASQHYQEMKNIIVTDYTGQKQFLKVIGEKSPVAEALMAKGPIPADTFIVPEKSQVDVKITSYLAHTPEAKRESVKELFSIMPNLPEDVILDAYGVGNIAEVIKHIKEKKEEEKQAEEAKMQAEAQAQQQGQEQQFSRENPSAGPQEAIAAVRTLIQGGTPQVPPRVSPEYSQAIDQILQREQQQGQLDPQILQAIQTFRDQVVQGVGR